VVSHILPHLYRDAAKRIPKAEGLGRLPSAHGPERVSGTFQEYDLGNGSSGTRGWGLHAE